MVDNGCLMHGNIKKDISLLVHCCNGNIEMLYKKRLLRHLATYFTGGVAV